MSARFPGEGASADAEAELGAELYARLHGGTEGDIAFYRRATQGAQSVLELGCGVGRILVPLAKSGRPMSGLDSDAASLAVARRRLKAAGCSANLIAGDMAQWSSAERFDRIIIPYNSLYVLPDDATIAAALRCARDHLTETGRIVFDVYPIDEGSYSGYYMAGKEFSPLCELTHGTQIVQVEHREEPVQTPHSFRVIYRLTLPRSNTAPRVFEHRIQHHFLTPDHLPQVVSDAGLHIESFAGDFKGTPFGPLSDTMVVQARAK